jgi:hypothetical protein
MYYWLHLTFIRAGKLCESVYISKTTGQIDTKIKGREPLLTQTFCTKKCKSVHFARVAANERKYGQGERRSTVVMRKTIFLYVLISLPNIGIKTEKLN